MLIELIMWHAHQTVNTIHNKQRNAIIKMTSQIILFSQPRSGSKSAAKCMLAKMHDLTDSLQATYSNACSPVRRMWNSSPIHSLRAGASRSLGC